MPHQAWMMCLVLMPHLVECPVMSLELILDGVVWLVVASAGSVSHHRSHVKV